jgi:hypothetical protein
VKLLCQRLQVEAMQNKVRAEEVFRNVTPPEFERLIKGTVGRNMRKVRLWADVFLQALVHRRSLHSLGKDGEELSLIPRLDAHEALELIPVSAVHGLVNTRHDDHWFGWSHDVEFEPIPRRAEIPLGMRSLGRWPGWAKLRVEDLGNKRLTRLEARCNEHGSDKRKAFSLEASR